MLIAINIILGKISVGPAFSAVNFGFISLVLAGYLYGVKLTMLAAVLANLLAFTIMGSGAFSFWFVIPAAIAGATYGLLHKPSLFRIFIVNIVVVVGVSFLFNTSLIAYVYHLNYEALLTTRIFKMITSLIVQVIVTYMLLNHTAMINLKKQR
ncbi:folate family ECF transporter S component [Leuconostoc gasicomitatum]|nr:Integral membrane protein [Leuconostoc gasicomitatum]